MMPLTPCAMRGTGCVLLSIGLLAVASPAPGEESAEMIRIAGGTYRIGADHGRPDARPTHEVVVAAFSLDRYEVTNAQFARFLNTLDVTVRRDAPAGHVRPADLEGADAPRLVDGVGTARPLIELNDEDARIGLVEGRFAPRPGFEAHPVTEVTWYGARVYCAWRGARLPTEAEWEAAARGEASRTYPWGEAVPSPERAVFGRRRGETAPVGRRPAGATPEGVHDLAGSLAEWTSSLYRPYPYAASDGREDPTASGERVTRGGDYVFDTAPDRLTAFFRAGFSRAVEHGHRHIGFRCAK